MTPSLKSPVRPRYTARERKSFDILAAAHPEPVPTSELVRQVVPRVFHGQNTVINMLRIFDRKLVKRGESHRIHIESHRGPKPALVSLVEVEPEA